MWLLKPMFLVVIVLQSTCPWIQIDPQLYYLMKSCQMWLDKSMCLQKRPSRICCFANQLRFKFGKENVITSAKSAFIPKTRVQVYFLEDTKRFKPLTNLIYKAKNGRVISDIHERFAFFSKASLAILPHLFWKPDLMWCNNWQSALVPAFYKEHYQLDDFYKNIKSILVVHDYEEEFIDINTGLFSKIGLSDPDGANKGLVNAYDAAAQNVDLIIAIDTPSKEVSKALIKLPSVKKNKLLIVKTADESPDYEKVADKINNRLQKLYS